MIEYRKYRPYGNIRKIWACKDPEILVEGSAGTGKTRGILEKLNVIANKYAGARILIVRQTRVSLNQTVLTTYKRFVKSSLVKFEYSLQQYLYPNGSIIALGGLDKPEKILSSEWDIIYVNEGTETYEDSLQVLKTRLRSNIVPYQQLIVDVNPSHALHWLNLRANTDVMTRIRTSYKDNPIYWNMQTNEFTKLGKQYIEGILSKLTGVLRLRYYEGKWANSEGLVYGVYDPAIHIIKPFNIPKSWKRYRAFDFGYSNPFVCQWYTVTPNDYKYSYSDEIVGDIEVLLPENSLIMYRELYYSKRTVTKHAKQINKESINESYYESVADHDASDRATLDENGIYTLPAYKKISTGIQAVIDRLTPDERTGRPTLYFVEGSLIELDPMLVNNKKPYQTVNEFGSYEWKTTTKGITEIPIDKDNHGVDTVRYMVAHIDEIGNIASDDNEHYVEVVEEVNYSNII